MAKHPAHVDPLERLREYVTRHGTQRAAAAALHVSDSYLSDLLNRRRPFSAIVLERLGLQWTITERRRA